MKTISAKKLSAFITMMFTCVLLFSQDQISHPGRQVINPLIGDESFISKYGYPPDAFTNEDLRIQTHLSYVENLLRQSDISHFTPELRHKRMFLLDKLREYWMAGKFPRNYDYSDRRPCFIDKDNTICAVGYLIEKTSGRDVAEQINKVHKYDDIMEMDNSLVDSWINESGFSKNEIAMIQPDYGGGFPPCWPSTPPPPLECKGNKIWDCVFSCCTLQWECKCVPPNGDSGYYIKPCNEKGNGNHGNGNNGIARNMVGVYAQIMIQYLQGIL